MSNAIVNFEFSVKFIQRWFTLQNYDGCASHAIYLFVRTVSILYLYFISFGHGGVLWMLKYVPGTDFLVDLFSVIRLSLTPTVI